MTAPRRAALSRPSPAPGRAEGERAASRQRSLPGPAGNGVRTDGWAQQRVRAPGLRRGARAWLAAALLLPLPAAAQAPSQAELAKQLANPVSSLVSVPFQFNYDGGFGPQDGDRAFVNLQPVVPIDVGADWRLISRTILPVIRQDDVLPGTDQFGLGDVTQSLFLSPAGSAGGIMWGAGPVFLLPTATDDVLGARKWGAGPTAVALRQSGPWTYGALANHVWSFAGEGGREEVNATFLQPFLAYTTAGATTISLNSETTYDWDEGEAAVPVNLQVSQLLDLGGQRVQLGAGVRYWIDAPDDGPEGFGARLTVTLLFPR